MAHSQGRAAGSSSAQKGCSRGQKPEPERGHGQLDAVLMEGTGLILGVGGEDLALALRFLQVSQPQCQPEVLREAAASSDPNHRRGQETG